MADLEQLKQKYAPVFQTIQSFSAEGATMEPPQLDGDKLRAGGVQQVLVGDMVGDLLRGFRNVARIRPPARPRRGLRWARLERQHRV